MKGREAGVPVLAESVLLGARWYVVTKVDHAAQHVLAVAITRAMRLTTQPKEG